MAFVLTPGHRHEQTAFRELMRRGGVKRPGPGRPRLRPRTVVGDKGYTGRPVRDHLRRHGIGAVIPQLKTEKARTRDHRPPPVRIAGFWQPDPQDASMAQEQPITPLRQRMLDDMKLRNMAVSTRKIYVASVAGFSAYHGRSPDQLTLEDVRDYQLHLVARGLKAVKPNLNTALQKVTPCQ
jgi:hypothetical protein